MKPELPEELASRARSWDLLTRWERAELGRSLRKLGWTYGEIINVISQPEFYKTYEKPPGRGRRKNRHEHGVCRVLVRRSADAWHRALAWIDTLAWTIDPAAASG